MRTPAAAIAWEFRKRHGWVAIVLGGYLLLLAAVRLLSIDVSGEQRFAFLVIVPMTAAFIFLLAVFSFGLDGDLAARHSIYPARMFALPVTTGALAAWPMLYGTIAMAVLWLATRLVAEWPAGTAVPILWPGLLAAALLAWTQALTWMPYALRGLRVVVTVLWLASIDTIVILALQFRLSEPVMLAMLLPHIPLAYGVARIAVARARRGDVPEWRLREALDILPQHRGRFRSPARAQAWFEYRQNGRLLPAIVGLLLPFELAMLFLFTDTPSIVTGTVLIVLLTPPFLATFASLGSGSAPFIATRPLSTGSLAVAKMEAAMRSTLVTWMLVIVALPAALRLSGAWPVVAGRARDVVAIIGTPRAIAIAVLIIAALVAATWKQLLFSLTLGVSGRKWLVRSCVLAAMALLVIAGLLAHRIAWSAVPWILAGFVCAKISVAAWMAAALRRHGLLADRMLLLSALSWDVLVFAMYGVLVWIFPPLLIRHYVLALIAILAIPLVRLSAMPLVLAWSRHR